MLRITIRNPAAQLIEVCAQETSTFQSTRGPVTAVDLQDQTSFPETPDHIQYRALCGSGTWFTVVAKEMI